MSENDHWRDFGAGFALGGGYAYQVRWLEFGADARYFDFGSAGRGAGSASVDKHALYFGVVLRPFVKVTDSVELGLDLRAGRDFYWWSHVPGSDGTSGSNIQAFNGFHVGAGPDARFWFTPHWAATVSVDASTGRLKKTDPDPGYLMREESKAGVFAAMATVTFAP